MKRISVNILLNSLLVLFPNLTLSFYITTTLRSVPSGLPQSTFYDWLASYLSNGTAGVFTSYGHNDQQDHFNFSQTEQDNSSTSPFISLAKNTPSTFNTRANYRYRDLDALSSKRNENHINFRKKDLKDTSHNLGRPFSVGGESSLSEDTFSGPVSHSIKHQLSSSLSFRDSLNNERAQHFKSSFSNNFHFFNRKVLRKYKNTSTSRSQSQSKLAFSTHNLLISETNFNHKPSLFDSIGKETNLRPLSSQTHSINQQPSLFDAIDRNISQHLKNSQPDYAQQENIHTAINSTSTIASSPVVGNFGNTPTSKGMMWVDFIDDNVQSNEGVLSRHQNYSNHHKQEKLYHLREAFRHEALEKFHASKVSQLASKDVSYQYHQQHQEKNGEDPIVNPEFGNGMESNDLLCSFFKDCTTKRRLESQTTGNGPDLGFLDPEVTPGLLQGDIAVQSFQEELRVGINWSVHPDKMWPNNTVPYAISPLYLPEERILIETAISALNFFSCINFVAWDGKEEDYLLIWPVTFPRGCWSYVGKRGGQQVVSLQRPDNTSLRCFVSLGKPIHELLHALGVYHEHTRQDRDNYVQVFPENALPDSWNNFEKQKDATNPPFSYDYDSVMHYGTHFFSKDGESATILPLNASAAIGQRVMLSALDCLKLNHLYGCLAGHHTAMYTAFCQQLAL